MICVDDARQFATVAGITARWSHLFSDIDDWCELLDLAEKIGLKPEWAQKRDKFPTMHFDVTDSKRRQAIAAGAKKITTAEFARMIAERNQGGSYDQSH